MNLEKLTLAVALTGVVTIHTGFWANFPPSAYAAPYLQDIVLGTNSSTSYLKQGDRQATSPELPNSILTAIQTKLQEITGLSRDNFLIKDFSPATWSDGCLGLGGAGNRNQICTQVLVPGWRVVVTERNVSTGGREPRVWTYRTNQTGTVLRLESSNN